MAFKLFQKPFQSPQQLLKGQESHFYYTPFLSLGALMHARGSKLDASTTNPL